MEPPMDQQPNGANWTRETLAAHIEECQRLFRTMPPLRCDSQAQPEHEEMRPYEQFIAENPLDFIDQTNEGITTNLRDFKRMPVHKLESCLRFFEGKSLTAKKKLVLLLKRVPAFRTLNIQKLEERLFKMKNWMRENGIPYTLDDLPLAVDHRIPEKDDE